MEAYGDVDKLNSTIGIVRAFNPELVGNHLSADRLEEELRWMQNKLFDVGGLLPRRPGKRSRICQWSQLGRDPAGNTHG